MDTRAHRHNLGHASLGREKKKKTRWQPRTTQVLEDPTVVLGGKRIPHLLGGVQDLQRHRVRVLEVPHVAVGVCQAQARKAAGVLAGHTRLLGLRHASTHAHTIHTHTHVTADEDKAQAQASRQADYTPHS